MAIEDVSPVNGGINVDFINPTETVTANYSKVAFVIVEEYRSNDSPENTDVWLRDATVVEEENGVVEFPDVTVHLNCVGAATAFRIGETQDLSPVDMDRRSWTIRWTCLTSCPGGSGRRRYTCRSGTCTTRAMSVSST